MYGQCPPRPRRVSRMTNPRPKSPSRRPPSASQAPPVGLVPMFVKLKFNEVAARIALFIAVRLTSYAGRRIEARLMAKANANAGRSRHERTQG